VPRTLSILLFVLIFISQAVAAGTDMTVPLDTFVVIPDIGRPDVQLAIHDDGRDDIKVRVGRARPARFQKHRGIETEDIETLIYSGAKGRVYYVNTIPDHAGDCVLRVKRD
jgi:hypothetical protein